MPIVLVKCSNAWYLLRLHVVYSQKLEEGFDTLLAQVIILAYDYSDQLLMSFVDLAGGGLHSRNLSVLMVVLTPVEEILMRESLSATVAASKKETEKTSNL